MSARLFLVSAGFWTATLQMALAQATTPVEAPPVFPQGSNRSSTQFTSDPERWRPVAYSDLKIPVGEAEAYASIWQDRLSESNAKNRNLPPGSPAPNASYGFFNRDAAEWHFSINFQSKLVALTVLYTPMVCTDEYPSPSPVARIFVCPMRVATFRDGQYSILDGAACYLVKTGVGPAEDSTATKIQASYDVNLRAFKIRYTVSHTDIAQCDQTIPLHPL
jgi:hypothetical protein